MIIMMIIKVTVYVEAPLLAEQLYPAVPCLHIAAELFVAAEARRIFYRLHSVSPGIFFNCDTLVLYKLKVSEVYRHARARSRK